MIFLLPRGKNYYIVPESIIFPLGSGNRISSHVRRWKCPIYFRFAVFFYYTMCFSPGGFFYYHSFYCGGIIFPLPRGKVFPWGRGEKAPFLKYFDNNMVWISDCIYIYNPVDSVIYLPAGDVSYLLQLLPERPGCLLVQPGCSIYR